MSVSDTTPNQSTTQLPLRPLMFTAFVCSMAMMAFVSVAGPIARTLHLEAWHIGMAMAAAGITWMLMARYWGQASDAKGRRHVILIGLGGFCLSYGTLTFFVDGALRFTWAPLLCFAGLLIGRAIAGAFYSAVPTTCAALVADYFPPQKRGKAMAAIGACSAAGMVVGPGMAGLLSTYSLTLPLYLTAILPILAFIAVFYTLPEKVPSTLKPKAPIRFGDPRLRHPLILGFTAAFVVGSAQVTVGFFALDHLKLNPEQAAYTAGWALASVGLALVIAQTIYRKIDWAPTTFIRFGTVIAGLGFGSVALVESAETLWAAFAFAACGMGWIYPSLPAITANAVNPSEQGIAAGTITAAQGLGTVMGPLFGTLLYSENYHLPYLLAAMMLFPLAIWVPKKSQ